MDKPRKPVQRSKSFSGGDLPPRNNDDDFMLNFVEYHKSKKTMILGIIKQLQRNQFTDCTLSARDKNSAFRQIKCHRVVLSAMSPVLEEMFLLNENNSVLILDHPFEEVFEIVDFIYRGQTVVPKNRMHLFFKLANQLQVKGLNGIEYLEEDKIAAAANNNEVLIRSKVEDAAVPHAKSPDNDNEMINKPEDANFDLKISATAKRARRMSIRLPPSQRLQVKKKKMSRKLSAGAKDPIDPVATLSLKCEFCSREYIREASLTAHQKECDGNPNQVFIECSECHLKIRPSAKYRHKKIHLKKA